MPIAMSATRSGFGAPPGRSAMMVASAAAAGIFPIATPPSFTQRFGLEVLDLADPDHDQAGNRKPRRGHNLQGRSVLGLEPLGLRRPLHQIAGRVEDGAGGRPEFEPVVTEHNKNAGGRG